MPLVRGRECFGPPPKTHCLHRELALGGAVEAALSEIEYQAWDPAHLWNDCHWGEPQVSERSDGSQRENGYMPRLELICQICVDEVHLFGCVVMSPIYLGGTFPGYVWMNV